MQLAAMVLGVLGLVGVGARLPVELADHTFDHDTQLGTHDTTGPWFVKFYAPWCGHCRRLEPVWNELAEALDGEVNVGSIDATKNNVLATRFKISGYPTVAFFKSGRMYKYSGARDLASLLDFAREGYKLQGDGLPIPKPLTKIDMLRKQFAAFIMDVEYVWTQRRPASYVYMLIGASFAMPIGALIAVFASRSAARSRKTVVKAKAQ